jgi:hypothetical protein
MKEGSCPYFIPTLIHCDNDQTNVEMTMKILQLLCDISDCITLEYEMWLTFRFDIVGLPNIGPLRPNGG